MITRPYEDKTVDTSPAETNIVINPNWTPGYQKARRLGKKLMYVCQKGERRSPDLAELGQAAGETETYFLEEGIMGLYNPYHPELMQLTPEQARAKLVELFSQNYLRILRDRCDMGANAKEYVWLQEQLTSLENEGAIAPGSYEYIRFEDGINEYVEQVGKSAPKK
jgi:hypothetical protein